MCGGGDDDGATTGTLHKLALIHPRIIERPAGWNFQET